MNSEFVLMLHAELLDKDHKFVEIFTSKEKLEDYLKNHPEVNKIEVTLHEMDNK